jgi:uncharacterized protein YegJ (DUF2314 family)
LRGGSPPKALAQATKLLGAYPALTPCLEVTEIGADAIQVLEPELLQYFARELSEAQKSELAGLRQGLLLRFKAPEVKGGLELVGQTYQFVEKAASTLGAYVWDDEARLAYDAESWKRFRLEQWNGGAPRVGDHIAIHAYKNGELIRAVTLGMVSFGLPDLAVDGIPDALLTRTNTLLEITAQTLLQRQQLDAPGKLSISLDDKFPQRLRALIDKHVTQGASRKAEVTLEVSTPDQGDAENRQAKLVFPNEGGSAQVGQARYLATLFGSPEAPMIQVAADDPQLKAATQRAREQLRAFEPEWQRNHRNGQLLVKSRFRTSDDGTEWMWVEVTEWKGDEMRGLLSNEPFKVPELHQGARVKVSAREIFDFRWHGVDGKELGGEAEDLLEGHAAAHP